MKSLSRDREAGEREGARPASRYSNPPQKGLIYQDFRAKQYFDNIKILGGRSAVKKVPKDFFDKLKGAVQKVPKRKWS